MRYKPFTGFLPVLPQYSTAPVQPLRQPDSFRLRQTESDWVRHLQTALRQSVQAFSSTVQAFSSCTALSTVLSAISGAYFLQYSTSWTISLVPGTYRTLYLVSAPLYCLQYSTTGIFSCIRVVQDSPPDLTLIYIQEPLHQDCPLI